MSSQIGIRYTDKARSDLREIFDYIAQDNRSAAFAVLAAIEAEIELLGYFPWNGRRTDIEGVLARTLSRYPYIVFYRVDEGELVVLQVTHGARRHPGFQEDSPAFAA